ncbi:hypothetical protein T261_0010 [Streptomyces lydicus]|nr:hypothetical protein T261_0010 [Streptomyces lydicus]
MRRGNQPEAGAGEQDGPTSQEQERLTRLRRENRQLRKDVEILKRATANCTDGPPTALAHHDP